MASTRVGQIPWNRNNRPRSPRAGNKQITRPRNKQLILKKLLLESKKFRVQVKQNGRVVLTMNVKRIAHYFSGKKKGYTK